MVLVIMWGLAVMALLALMVAWGATIDDASRQYARSRRPVRVSRRIVSSASH
jgi:hypothetical protein